MNRPIATSGGLSVPRPTQAVLGLIAANVIIYILELILLRAGANSIVELFFLTPRHVYARGHIWQVLTYGWLHSPGAPGHLLWNMLWLWMFGHYMENWWGRNRFIRAYLVFILAGGLLTVLVGLLADLTDLSQQFPNAPHLGASGATLGITVAWGLTHANRQLNLLFLGPMKGSTFVWLMVGIQVLFALSFANTSSTAHFGGIIGAFVLCRGLWRPSTWKKFWRQLQLRRSRAAIEKELRTLEKQPLRKNPPPGWHVIDGGEAKPPDDDPKKWN